MEILPDWTCQCGDTSLVFLNLFIRRPGMTECRCPHRKFSYGAAVPDGHPAADWQMTPLLPLQCIYHHETNVLWGR